MKHGDSVQQYLKDYLERKWQEHRVRLFCVSERRCVKSGCKQFKAMAMEGIKKLKDEDTALIYTALELTDYTPACDKIIDDYAEKITDGGDIRKMLEKKGYVCAMTGVRELFGFNKTTGKVDKRVDVIYCLLVSKKFLARLMIDEITSLKPAAAAPAQSNAPALD